MGVVKKQGVGVDSMLQDGVDCGSCEGVKGRDVVPCLPVVLVVLELIGDKWEEFEWISLSGQGLVLVPIVMELTGSKWEEFGWTSLSGRLLIGSSELVHPVLLTGRDDLTNLNSYSLLVGVVFSVEFSKVHTGWREEGESPIMGVVTDEFLSPIDVLERLKRSIFWKIS